MVLALRSGLVIDFVLWMNGSTVLATRVGITGQKWQVNFVTLRNPEIISVPQCDLQLIRLRCSTSEAHEYISSECTPNKAKNIGTKVFMLTCWIGGSWLLSLPWTNCSVLKNALCLLEQIQGLHPYFLRLPPPGRQAWMEAVYVA